MAGAGGDPVATTFQAPASQNIDNAKADALNNIAQNGAKGAAAMAATAQANAAARTQALQNAMAYASLRGAPAGNAAQGQQTVAQPFDQRASVLGLMHDNYAQNNQAMQQANTNYMEGIKAGLPIAQTALDRTISNNQSANAAKRDAQAFQLAMKQAEMQSAMESHNVALQLAQARLQALQDKQSAPETLAQFISRNGGADLVGDQLKGAVDARGGFSDPASQIKQVGGGHPGAGVNEVAGPDTVLPSIVDGSPMPPSVARMLINDSMNKDISQQNALNRGGNTVDQQSVGVGVQSAANYLRQNPTGTFDKWWSGFVSAPANAALDSATLTAIRDNARAVFPSGTPIVIQAH